METNELQELEDEIIQLIKEFEQLSHTKIIVTASETAPLKLVAIIPLKKLSDYSILSSGNSSENQP